jgi:hypothetical protein
VKDEEEGRRRRRRRRIGRRRTENFKKFVFLTYQARRN